MDRNADGKADLLVATGPRMQTRFFFRSPYLAVLDDLFVQLAGNGGLSIAGR